MEEVGVGIVIVLPKVNGQPEVRLLWKCPMAAKFGKKNLGWKRIAFMRAKVMKG